MKKMYIAVLDEAPDYMVPTLVAHSAINAHMNFAGYEVYQDWLENSYRKVVLRVNRKEFDKIADTLVSVSYTHLTLPTISCRCRSRWSPSH